MTPTLDRRFVDFPIAAAVAVVVVVGGNDEVGVSGICVVPVVTLGDEDDVVVEVV